MALDKEKLYAFYRKHYLSRQDVLSKLPLSISIGPFWEELLRRRKQDATVLPLSGANGTPYWYVLTDRMIAASERLCEEAMSEDEPIDPYRAPMTAAMLEELFFTSFVEGAQITPTEAMAFLDGDSEPGNIREQMLHNNRRAWQDMMQRLFYPFDGELLKELNAILADDMTGDAGEYRSEDTHQIVAMGDEEYKVIPAFMIESRMDELCKYLSLTSEHPLLKAAIAQAMILIERPFSEGNERLARLISSAVLLRSGYDFFRDISLSAQIARESFKYYKAMRDIIREENGNDLTYFIEYYLCMLVRATDTKKEAAQKRNEQAIKRERELAKQPLVQRDDSVIVLKADDVKQNVEIAESVDEVAMGDGTVAEGVDVVAESVDEADSDVKFSDISDEKVADVEVRTLSPAAEDLTGSEPEAEDESEDIAPPVTIGDVDPPKAVRGDSGVSPGFVETEVTRFFRNLDIAGSGILKRIRDTILHFCEEGKREFTSADWVECNRVCRSTANHDIQIADAFGAIDIQKDPYTVIYSIRETRLKRSDGDWTDREKQAMHYVVHVLPDVFSCHDITRVSPKKSETLNTNMMRLVARGVLSRTGNNSKATYRLTAYGKKVTSMILKESRRDTTGITGVTGITGTSPSTPVGYVAMGRA